jgi:hypothetical protein
LSATAGLRSNYNSQKYEMILVKKCFVGKYRLIG